jgi:arylsulfatase A-like enzyme
MARVAMKSPPLLACAFALAACRSAPEARPGGSPGGGEKPNIVLIVADDFGADEIGARGDRKTRTPQIDRLAREGLQIDSFYVTWPACTPSRASILTGRYPQRNGLYDMIRNDLVNYGHKYTEAEYAVSAEMILGLDVREVTVGQVLASAGYATGVVGKWDGGRARRFLPLQRGFGFFYGFANTGIDYLTHERYGIPSLMRGNERIVERPRHQRSRCPMAAAAPSRAPATAAAPARRPRASPAPPPAPAPGRRPRGRPRRSSRVCAPRAHPSPGPA